MNIISEINYYTFSLLLGGVIALISGAGVYLKGEKGRQDLAWLLLNLSTAVWSFGYLLMVVSTNSKIALLSNWVLHFGAILIPFFYFLFIISITDTYQTYKKYLYVGSVFLVAFFLLSTTPLFVKGVLPKYPFNYAPDAGPLYVYFALYFFIFVVSAIFILLSKIHKTQGEDALRLKYILWSSVAGFIGGGGVFFLTFNINIPPYLLIMFSLYPLIISYAILRYNLFNLKLVLVELAVLLLNMFLLFNVFTSHATADLVLNISVSLFVLMFSVILVRGIYKDIRDRERIEVLAKEMVIANERMRALEGQKTEFVSIASHQLRTPLTVIKGYASMILEGTFGTITDDVRDAIGKLYKSSDKIVALVEDLLTVSRLEQGRMTLHFEPVNLVELTQGVLSEIATETAEAGVDLSFTTEENKQFIAEIDQNKFKQVMKHILENAIKYTRAPGGVRVSLSEDNITNKIRLSVSDTGTGMSAEQIKALFERFDLKVGSNAKTSDNLTKEEFNNSLMESAAKKAKLAEAVPAQKMTPGIGLYIAKQIIDAHHGRLLIESAGENRGVTVTIEFPRVAVSTEKQ